MSEMTHHAAATFIEGEEDEPSYWLATIVTEREGEDPTVRYVSATRHEAMLTAKQEADTILAQARDRVIARQQRLYDAAEDMLKALEQVRDSGLIHPYDPVGDPGTLTPVWDAVVAAIAKAKG